MSVVPNYLFSSRPALAVTLMGLAGPYGQSKGIGGDSFQRHLNFEEVYLRIESVNSSSADTVVMVFKCS